MGRPPKFNDTILVPVPQKDGSTVREPRVRWEVIVERVRAGSYPEVAAMSTGVSARAFYTWKAKGEDRVENGKVRRARAPYEHFVQALTRAEAEAEMLAIAHVAKAMPDDWRAAAFYLERRGPQRWRKRDSVWHGGPGEGDAPLALDLSGKVDLSDDAVSRLDAVLDVLRESGALDGSEPAEGAGEGADS